MISVYSDIILTIHWLSVSYKCMAYSAKSYKDLFPRFMDFTINMSWLAIYFDFLKIT